MLSEWKQNVAMGKSTKLLIWLCFLAKMEKKLKLWCKYLPMAAVVDLGVVGVDIEVVDFMVVVEEGVPIY